MNVKSEREADKSPLDPASIRSGGIPTDSLCL